jgi:hypothetical protein
MPILDTTDKQQFIKKFLIKIAKTQHHGYWVKVDPRSVIADLGLKAGQNRVKTLRGQLQNIMPQETGIIRNSDILKDKQTVAGFLAVAFHRAKFVTTEPSGDAWIAEIISLQQGVLK